MRSPLCAAALAAVATLTLAACEHTTGTSPTTTSSTSSMPTGVLSDRTGDSIWGTVRALDGDTLSIHGIRVDLIAINAPTLKEQCVTAGETVIPCGEWARDSLAKAVRVGKTRCRMVANKPRQPDRPLAFCAVEIKGDRDRLADMTVMSHPGVQEQADIYAEMAERIRGFRSVDPERGTLNIDLGAMQVQSGLAKYVPESIAHLPWEVRELADYSAHVPGHEMSDEQRALIERFGR